MYPFEIKEFDHSFLNTEMEQESLAHFIGRNGIIMLIMESYSTLNVVGIFQSVAFQFLKNPEKLCNLAGITQQPSLILISKCLSSKSLVLRLFSTLTSQ